MKRLIAIASALFVVALSAQGLPVAAAAESAGPTCESGSDYIKVGGHDSAYTKASEKLRPEAHLRYTIFCPQPTAENPGPFPTLFVYSGYNHSPDGQTGGHSVSIFNKDGYVVIGVAPRGTNCSEGAWDFGHPNEAADGYDVVEWIADQKWSNGKIAMIGESYAAILQYPVAALNPPSLDAIAAQQPLIDLYRDVAYPGGIFNVGVAGGWSGFQFGQGMVGLANTLLSDAQELPEGGPDARCANQLDRREPLVEFGQRPWDGSFYEERLARGRLDDIDVPVWTTLTWQDGLTGPRAAHLLSEVENLYAIVSNGGHSIKTRPTRDRDAFLDYYLRGECRATLDRTYKDVTSCVDGRYEAPSVRVWWESSGGGGAPRFTSAFNSWQARDERPYRFYLSGDGSSARGGGLRPGRPAAGGADTYAYVPDAGPTKSQIDVPRTTVSRSTWEIKQPSAGTSVTYTSPVFEEDVAMLGSGSLDLWLSSSADDTDVQVTISEVRPKDAANPTAGYGEVYIQRGWLRASHRALDESRSTPLLPYHTHKEADGKKLKPGEPTLMRIEVMPFGHVFRAGSHLRLTIEAPSLRTENWGLQAHPVPALNTVHHDRRYDSKLVLPVLATLPSGFERTYPACGSLTGQPCRDVEAPQSSESWSDATEVTFVEGSASGGQFSDDVDVAARVVDSAGEPLEGAEVAFDLGGAEETQSATARTDADGIARATITLGSAPGGYELYARYRGDDGYDPSSASTAFVIAKEQSVTALAQAGSGGTRELVARVSDHDSPAFGVASVEVTFFAGTTEIGTAQTGDDGVARLSLPRRYYGPNVFRAVFAGSDYFEPSSGTVGP